MRWLLVVVFVALPRLGIGAPEDFPRPRGIETQVEFWKNVFAVYSENQIVVHDNYYLDKIYSVIDLRPLAASGADEETLRRMKHVKENTEKERIDRALAELAAGRAPESLDEMQKHIVEMFQDVGGAAKYREARERVRSQWGLRERFARGIEISRRYLPYMESIFRSEGLPVELTRLPFVESTFNVRAYSKVGAAGLWQFIPSSARIYLKLNDVEDSRRDPLDATVGAAHHLKDDYEALGSWPLAVTAYNHGRGGVARAVEQTGSRDLGDIIRGYSGHAFGFASRNFYAEFLAAMDVERDHKQHFGDLDYEPKLQFQEVTVRDFVPFGTIAKLAGCSKDDLLELNPGFTATVVAGKLYVPKGYTIRVPAGRAQRFASGYANLSAKEKFSGQRRIYLVHKVKKGQTIGTIAKRYRTTVAAIQVANGLRDTRRLKTGQRLKIPSG